jgi:hypothetical protein
MDGERGIPLEPPGSFLNAARDPDTVAYTTQVSSDTWFAHSSARAGSRGERAPRGSRARHVAGVLLATRGSLIPLRGLAHVANVLHVAREPDTSHVSSDTWFAQSSARAGSRGERAPRGFFF